MSVKLQLREDGDEAVEIHAGSVRLLRYVHRPGTPADESPRPFAHPVCTLQGEVLTNLRPNDHRWHHGLSFTITSVDGVNFWGGPTHRAADGYQWRGDHGRQAHVGWRSRTAERLAHALEWTDGAGGVLLREERALSFTAGPANTWTLRWQASLENVAGRPLVLGNYASLGGLKGSHYTGLQFRGARDLLDEHHDAGIGIWADGGLSGEAAIHGAATRWLEWRGQKDGSQRRVTIRFTNHAGPQHWFVRRGNPLVALPFQYDRDLLLPPAGILPIDHTLSFSDA